MGGECNKLCGNVSITFKIEKETLELGIHNGGHESIETTSIYD